MTKTTPTLGCIAYGVPFNLAAEDPALLAQLACSTPCNTLFLAAPAFSALTFTAHLNPTGFSLTVGDHPLGEVPDTAAVIELLTQELMVHVADHAAGRVFIHAGVVGWRGGAIVLPGTSFAGKSTLVAALVRAGAQYYSDEYAVLDEQGCVHPYPRDLQMRNPGRPEQRPLKVEQIGGHAGSQPLPVLQVAFCQYRKAAKWSPRSVSAGVAVLEMLRHAIPVQRTPGRVMATLSTMMNTATAICSLRGEADRAASALLRMLDQNTQAACA